ncbi:hypothetical protein ADL00_07070 [Streptomyces sp. AS58]|uniref:FAD-binding oxidoreductase n=1 Tax=Streptomyces sp. AS58 TaxID=1519489 RepID=UPI0006AE4D08|nr:FAD-binding protein [Streptomyces sp. AS58]KOV71805.1 hypothetical protein ADL00_07070 [Streptomyces sp. AS58]
MDGEVRFDAGTRGAYSTDGSNYRQVPIDVVIPRTVEAAEEAVAVCREHDAPLLSRGVAPVWPGSAATPRWLSCNRLLSVDAENRRCVVEPGIVLDDLDRRLAAYGLQYGPRPATHRTAQSAG